MAQKIIRIGSSVGVTIPKEILKATHLEVGDQVVLGYDDRGIHIEPQKNTTKASETAEWATEFVQKHIEAFKELADK